VLSATAVDPLRLGCPRSSSPTIVALAGAPVPKASESRATKAAAYERGWNAAATANAALKEIVGPESAEEEFAAPPRWPRPGVHIGEIKDMAGCPDE